MQSNGGGSDGAAERGKASPPVPKAAKFAVYQNQALSAALTANSLQPSKSNLLCIFTLSSVSAFALLSIVYRESSFVDKLSFGYLSKDAAYIFAKTIQSTAGLVFIGTICAFYKVVTLHRAKRFVSVPVLPPSKGMKEQPHLTSRQLGLLGIKPKVDKVTPESLKKPPMSRTPLRTSTDILVPLHQPFGSSHRKPPVGSDKSNASSGNKINNFSSLSMSQGSPFSATTSPLRSVHTSPGQDVSTPWSKTRSSFAKDIATEERLEQFLAEVGEKITESAGKLSTPPPTISGFGVTSPNTIGSPASASGTMRSTPLRAVRMSPGSQKFTPPKKGEGDLPPPMSIEESIAAFQQLGIYPEIEQWRDRLRQWFSSILLKPLLNKIETSHIQVMQAAAKLGISITINQVGNEITSGTPSTLSSAGGTKEWQPSFTLDEDSILHQIRATLVQALDTSTRNVQQSTQQNAMIPVMQECVDAITEHQRLQSLMKGELVKGLLPHSNVREDYTVQRTRELAEGTCLKNYEYVGTGEVYDKKNKKWTLELPTDSHLLLYLFCAYLEHPKWMLHVDPTSYGGAHSSKNPLFLGVLPPKERFPEKYIAVISGVPSVLHPGACVLAVGRQSPPIFVLYWDKKVQLPLQGRTALWDSILLLCHRVKDEYGGIVRGLHLGSSAISILPVLDSEMEN